MNFDNTRRIGLLGGGQLGRMLLQAAIDFDLHVHVLDPDPQASCHRLTPDFRVGSFQDFDTVYDFGKNLDVITVEIESVNLEALKALQQAGVQVFPQPEVLEIIQDKRSQKQFFRENNLPTAEFVLTDDRADARRHAAFLPAVHKIGKGGYDGRGVQLLRQETDFDAAFDAPAVLEKAIDFEKELAVIVARRADGQMAAFPTVEMVFHPEANLVESLFAPADISPDLHEKACHLAQRTAEAFGIVGLLAVELFLTKNGQLLINEVAPRPHNSGHHTIRANDVSQYEQHWRAVLGWPLGQTAAHSAAGMLNLLGAEGHQGPAHYEGLEQLLAEPGVHPFLYGKSTTRPFRKMGHITLVAADLTELRHRMQTAGQVKVVSTPD